MKNITLFLAFLCVIVSFPACKKETKSVVYNNIIVPPRKDAKVDTVVHRVNSFDVVDTVHWVGSVYKVRCQRYTNDSLSYIKTEEGKMFRDNIIKLTITRPDQSVFFEKVFKKGAFNGLVSPQYAEKSVLLGVALEKEKVDKDNLYFLGTIGNPDELTDEFFMFEVVISRMGDVAIRKMELDENKRSESEDV